MAVSTAGYSEHVRVHGWHFTAPTVLAETHQAGTRFEVLAFALFS